MVYIFGLAVVFFCVVVFWTIRALINAVRNWHRRRQPSLPPPVTQPTLSETAENVFTRFMASTMAEDLLDPTPPLPARRRSSVYSGVVRAHPECGSDPELPHYSSAPTASRPELIIIEDEDMPPPLTPLGTPRSSTPVSENSTTGLVTEAAPGYTTRPATPQPIREAPVDPPVDPPGPRQMASLGQRAIPLAPYAATAPAAAPIPHVTFAQSIGARLSREDMPTRPPTARRKHNQRRGRSIAEITLIATV